MSWDGFNKLKPVREPWIDPYAYVMSANLHRRHLTPEQRRELVAKLLKASPESPTARSPSSRRSITRPSVRSAKGWRQLGKFPS